MPDLATTADLTGEEIKLINLYRGLLDDPDLQLPYMENTSAGFGLESGLQVNLTLSKRRD